MAFNFNDIKTDDNHSSNVVLTGATLHFLKNANPFEVLNAEFNKSYYYRGYKEDENPFGFKNFFWLNKKAGTEPRKYFDMMEKDLGFKPAPVIVSYVAKEAYEENSTNLLNVYEREWMNIMNLKIYYFKNYFEKDLGLHITEDNLNDISEEERKRIHDYYFNVIEEFEKSGLSRVHMELLRYYTNRDNDEYPSVEIQYSPDNGIYVLISCDNAHYPLQLQNKTHGYPNIHFSYTGLKNYFEHYKTIKDNGETALKKFNDVVNKKILKNYGIKVPPEYFINHEETDEYYLFYLDYKGEYKFNDPCGKIYLPSNIYKFYHTLLGLYDLYNNKPSQYKYPHHMKRALMYSKYNLAFQSEDDRFLSYIEEIDKDAKKHRHVIKVLK